MPSNTNSESTLDALSNDLATAVERAGRATVAVHARPRIPSTGVHWRAGVIVTAAHTMKRDEEITVTLADGRTVSAAIAGRDPATDIAVLRLENHDAPPAELGESAALKVGHIVLALGRAGGDVSASLGLVSAISTDWRTWHGGVIDRLIHLDLAIYDGFSGGPLVDARGAIVGINSSGVARGLAASIPRSTVDRVTDQLLSAGRIARGYVGLAMQPVRLPSALMHELALPSDGGVILVGVEAGGPGATAGAMIGDVVVALDGKPVRNTDDLLVLLGPESVGKHVQARIIRGGALHELSIVVGERSRRHR
ncbi:MAG TPA: trypsin-like peptidase domain-containing protein [Gemmatimonadaceae bacterium]|nr:trypsin-like peptidase domain-containing protein [Gemmatimonadaceae bacterium]